jgi:pyruvate kinase
MGHESSISAAPTEWALERIDQQLNAFRLDMLQAERQSVARWSGVPESRRDSARNLIHYMAMRQQDRRPLQAQLAAQGLSSLGRAAAQALPGSSGVAICRGRPRREAIDRERYGREQLAYRVRAGPLTEVMCMACVGSAPAADASGSLP